MRKATTLFFSFLLLTVFTSCTRTPDDKSGAAAGEDLTKLLPDSTAGVFILDLKKILELDVVVKALQDYPKAKQGLDELANACGIDLRKDVRYVGVGIATIAERLLMPRNETEIKNMAIVINLRYDKTRFKDMIKEKIPKAKEETYSGVPIYSNLDDDDKPMASPALTEPGKINFQVALLDASHIVLGGDRGVKGVIDVYQNKVEPLAKSPEMTALLGRVNKSGIAWGALSYPPELVRKAAEANPGIKALEGFKGVIIAFDDKNSRFSAEVRFFGGTKEQNANSAAQLNGLRALGSLYAAKEPALGELLSGLTISWGQDYARLDLDVSHETLGKLGRLVKPKTGELTEPIKEEPEAEVTAAPDYFPLRPGTVREYSLTLQNGNSSQRVAFTQTLLPKTTLKGMEVFPSRDMTGSIAFIAKTKEGIGFVAIQPVNDREPTLYDSPLIEVPRTRELGFRWQERVDSVVRKGVKLLKTSTVDKMDETVTVPAGVFEHCLGIKRAGRADVVIDEGGVKQTVPLILEVYDWYAPNVGSIKTTFQEILLRPASSGGKEVLKYVAELTKISRR